MIEGYLTIKEVAENGELHVGESRHCAHRTGYQEQQDLGTNGQFQQIRKGLQTDVLPRVSTKIGEKRKKIY